MDFAMNAGRLRLKIQFALTLLVLSGTAIISAQPLVWDAMAKAFDAKPGDTNANFTFNVTNISPADVLINGVRTSCGCTVARLPALPWRLGPATNGQIEIAVDLRGKRGILSKVITVDASSGMQMLTVNVNIPEPDERERNKMMAQADRQAIFRNECASCHAQPALGKKGEPLYAAACGICHDAAHRASMVPDLKALTKPADSAYWKSWIAHGKAGSLMPAFAKAEGGPLDEAQVESLVDYLTQRSRPRLVFDLANPFPDPSQ
jgi:cytochrome c553